VGNECLWVVDVSGSWDKRSFLLFCATSLLSLLSLEFPCSMEFSPSSGVTHCCLIALDRYICISVNTV
jgi:hypothetical protein